MPHANPRLSVVLPPSLHATLTALGQATGESASSIVRDLLMQTEPALRRMLRLVRAANGAKDQIGQGVGATLFRVVEDIEDELQEASGGDVGYPDLVDQAHAQGIGKRRGGAGGARPGGALPGGSTPVPVTRGSGTGKTRRTARRTGGR